MADTDYAGYAYKRTTKKRRFSFFLIGIIVLSGVLGYMVFGLLSNMQIGGGSRGEKVKLEGATLWAVQVDAHAVKTDAYASGEAIKKDGGAGYLVYDNAYCVFENVYTSRDQAEQVVNGLSAQTIANAVLKEIEIKSVDVQLSSEEDYEIVKEVCDLFLQNAQKLNSFIASYNEGEITGEDIASNALALYNELGQLLLEFSQVQEMRESVFYSNIILHANKQLLALYVLSSRGASSSIVSDTKSAVCAIVFAYNDLVKTSLF